MNKLIEEARELCEKATPGPWEWICDDPAFLTLGESGAEHEYHVLSAWKCGSCQKTGLNCLWPEKYDAAFIARSRTLIPELCDALEKAEEEVERMKIATSKYCHNDCYRDACAGNEGVGIPDCPLVDFSPPVPEPPEV